MTICIATITTADPARIIRSLCKHWRHKFTVEYDDQKGRVELPMGVCEMQADADQLTFRLLAQPDADATHFEQVVADHAQRMARGETFAFDWQRDT